MTDTNNDVELTLSDLEIDPPSPARSTAGPRPARQAAPAPAVAPSAWPPIRVPRPLAGRAEEKADVLVDDILSAYERAGRLLPGAAEEIRARRARQSALWPTDPAEAAGHLVGILEAPQCPYREGERTPANVADVALLFADRALGGNPDRLIEAVADLAHEDPAKMARGVARRLLEGDLDHLMRVRRPLPPDARQVREALDRFTPDLADDADLDGLARRWSDLGHTSVESTVRSVANRLGMTHHAVGLTRDGRPVHFDARDPRLHKPPQVYTPVNPGLGAF